MAVDIRKSSVARLESLQVLRGCAAFAVLISHVALEMRHHATQFSTIIADAFNSGRAGVDVFFVISGFVMMYVTADRFGSAEESRRFIIKRLARIVPVYWFYTTLMLCIALAIPHMLRHTSMTPDYIVSSYLFFPSLRPGSGDAVRPLLDLGWTLNYEMYFYLLFAAALLFSRRTGLVTLTAFFALSVSAGMMVTRADPALWFWSRPVVLEFLAGIGVALLYHSQVRWARWTVLAALVLAVAWLIGQVAIVGAEMRLIRFGIPAILLVCVCTLPVARQLGHRASTVWKLFLLMGESSYSLYLSHMFVIGIAMRGFVTAATGLSALLYCTFVMALALLVAVASHRFIEMPAKAAVERLLALKRAGPERAMVH